MSKVVVNSVVLGQSGTDTNNFLLDTDAAGALRIRRKSDGSGGTVLTIDSAGRILFATLSNYTSDMNAAAGGIAVGQLYRNGSAVQVRVS